MFDFSLLPPFTSRDRKKMLDQLANAVASAELPALRYDRGGNFWNHHNSSLFGQ